MTELTTAQLQAEISRCEACATKPCKTACPAHCSPADFIMAARVGEPSDLQRAAAEILTHNPLGGICGAVCPEFHCMAACSRAGVDAPVRIPDVQQTLIQRADDLGLRPRVEVPAANGKLVAVIGAGPAGLAAAFTLSRWGYTVELFERSDRAGGACRLIPEHRLPRRLLEADIAFLLDSDSITLHTRSAINDPAELEGFDAVILAAGLTEPIRLGIPGEEAAVYGWHYLADPTGFPMDGAVAILGGGAVAADCAFTARLHGAERVEIFSLEKYSEMPLAERERQDLIRGGIHVNGRTRLTAISHEGGRVTGLRTLRVAYEPGDRPLDDRRETPALLDVTACRDLPGTEQLRDDFSHVIIAIGHRSSLSPAAGVVVAGDCTLGPSTVVQASASGKNAAAEVHARLGGESVEQPHEEPIPGILPGAKSRITVPGYNRRPVSLETEFFGRTLLSPFLLSAAPPTDGYEQMRRAMLAGWAGGIMKTAFDGVPIHIPNEYMFALGRRTWANCDNVSGHSLDRVCGEIERLVREFPDQLIAASTGGPVCGVDEADAAVWQSNTRKLEAAGSACIEYSLSCPQGGDGTEGDIVSQSAPLTAQIIDWILAAGDPAIPKLFKLTAAVTSVEAIIIAIRAVLDRYPQARAGVTLANTFPSLGFRPGAKKSWEEGVIVGMSGEGITPISNMTLAKVSGLGVHVSGNGGPMDYKAAANFLALGARTVQFCTVCMEYGYDIIDELESGLSHLMAVRNIASVGELIGIALPDPVTDFMDLSPTKRISAVDSDLCVSCGNCSRCSYLAVSLDDKGHPVIDPERCVGCSICAKKCISGALFMRDRSPEELANLRES
jgi:NADPH-dependent glutamate synthase beta subunit-like oxidoreductase/dihydroorotate dehydrogenase/Pyruvate/2-oxoacid:ferredoxin oxidoreductase delta subunit